MLMKKHAIFLETMVGELRSKCKHYSAIYHKLGEGLGFYDNFATPGRTRPKESIKSVCTSSELDIATCTLKLIMLQSSGIM